MKIEAVTLFGVHLLIRNLVTHRVSSMQKTGCKIRT
jgi:hypothetical protein